MLHFVPLSYQIILIMENFLWSYSLLFFNVRFIYFFTTHINTLSLLYHISPVYSTDIFIDICLKIFKLLWEASTSFQYYVALFNM